MKRNERTYQQWKDLAERYFEAETTPEEEKELACFLATPLSQSKDFEELRAVMGFMAMGRATHRKRQVHIPLCRCSSCNRHLADGYGLATGRNKGCLRCLHQWRTHYRYRNRTERSNEICREGTSQSGRSKQSGETTYRYFPDAGRKGYFVCQLIIQCL